MDYQQHSVTPEKETAPVVREEMLEESASVRSGPRGASVTGSRLNAN